MRGGWDLKDLQDVAYGELLFTKQQSKVIETEVIRRNGIDLQSESAYWVTAPEW
jgi:hypothetical protein